MDESQNLIDETQLLKEQLEGLEEPQISEIKSEIQERTDRIEKLDNIIQIAKGTPPHE